MAFERCNVIDWMRLHWVGERFVRVQRVLMWFVLVHWVLMWFVLVHWGAAAEPWRVGFAKRDITPEQGLRLSGYAGRGESSVGVADPLSVRAMVISPQAQQEFPDSLVLVAIDSIAITNAITVETAAWLLETHGISRSQLVLSSTHSHAAPHLDRSLENLFSEPLTEQQREAARLYTRRLVQQVQAAISAAIESRTDAQLAIGEATANIAVNRRLLNDGKWSGFGIQPNGQVDQRVRVMRCTAPDGRLLGAAFMYACHCTTLGPSFNEVSGDWAGLAASRLEHLHAESVFLPIIGCGADANPNPRESYAFAEQHAATMVDSVLSVLRLETLAALDTFPQAQFGYAGLVPEQPTAERLQSLLQSESPNERRWAEHMRDVKQKMGRLPESYPMPIHTWQFGDQLTWVFLGGEVVADYQFKLEQRIASQQTWVAAYCDDVFAYVASEAMRDEGGYEVDASMIYYLQPGRWESGSQELILQRVNEVLKQQHADDKPLTAEESLAAIRVPEGFQVELVAAEPLVRDPVNIAFGIDGKVWVVEMHDYPLGTPGGGRVKWLRDTDGDGRLDEAHVFLDGLSYPTSVFPWREGVLIIAAPDVIYAEDFNGDGVADRRETWLTGIGEANPQHRASGFEMGLDGWLHFSPGDQTQHLHVLRSNEIYEVEGHDVAWKPDTGQIRKTTGETQFVRARDAFGNWFGNSNSYPMYQFVIDDRYLQHSSVSGGAKQHLLEPAAAPPVLPRSRTVERFNDQFARNRFTSACSSIVARVPGVDDLHPTQPPSPIGFICEPVHNLVARIHLDGSGSAFTARRHPQDAEADFFTSTDAWSRPVRIVNAPDGTLWVVDMVRRVIEHPQWIPTAWQERLDLRSGSGLGRIYRVHRKDFQPKPFVGFSKTPNDLLPMLASQNGVIRDLAVQALCESDFSELESHVRSISQEDSLAATRVSALGCLAAKGWLTQADVVHGLTSDSPACVRFSLELAEQFSSLSEELTAALQAVVERQLGPQVDLQWVLTSTLLPELNAAEGLQAIARRSADDAWIAKALTLVMGEEESLAALQAILTSADQHGWNAGDQLEATLAGVSRLWQRLNASSRAELSKQRTSLLQSRKEFIPSDVLLLAAISTTEPWRLRPNEDTAIIGNHAPWAAT